jgi:hypothetical protein
MPEKISLTAEQLAPIVRETLADLARSMNENGAPLRRKFAARAAPAIIETRAMRRAFQQEKSPGARAEAGVKPPV